MDSRTWEETPFGEMLLYDIPDDCDVVIVCNNDGTGLEPVALRLPHQVYRDSLKGLKGVTLVPAQSGNYIPIGSFDEAGNNPASRADGG